MENRSWDSLSQEDKEAIWEIMESECMCGGRIIDGVCRGVAPFRPDLALFSCQNCGGFHTWSALGKCRG